MIRRLRTAAMRLRRDDGGSAIVEFTFLAVLVMLPLVYLVVAVAVVQRSSSAAGDAARAAGRALGQADSLADGGRRAEAAVRMVFEDQGLPPDSAQIRIVAASTDCSGRSMAPSLAPGSEFAVCVVTRAEIPGVPTIFEGRGIQTVGRYVVHVDDFRR